jgi:hypothetical protein
MIHAPIATRFSLLSQNRGSLGTRTALSLLRLMKDKNYLDNLFLVCVIKGSDGGDLPSALITSTKPFNRGMSVF